MPPTPGPTLASALSTKEFRRLADVVDGHTRANRWPEAEAACRAALGRYPNDGPLLQMLGITLVRAGRLPEAIEVLRRSAQLWPAPQAWMSLGTALLAVRREGEPADEAIAAFARASALKPGNVEADLWLGHLLLDTGRPADAEAAYRRALAAAPGKVAGWVGLGNALYAQKQLPAALDCYRRGQAIDPNDANASLNTGNVLAAQGRRTEAIAAFRHCLAVRPNDPRAMSNLGTALFLDGQLDGAEAMLRRRLAQSPDDTTLLVNLAGVMKDKGRLDEAIAINRRAIEVDPTLGAAHSNLIYTLSFHPGYTPAAVLAEARRYDAMHTAALTASALPHANDRSPDRRLRVGYVSPDLKHHAVGGFLLPLLEHHDRSAVEVTLYGLAVNADDLTARLQGQAARWRDLGGLSDEQAANAIRADGIDVLVDLTLHMGNNRLPIFARRAGPVQVTYLAYAGTSGLAAMDYRLSDPYLDPSPADDADYSERTIRLPRSYWCYRPMYDAPAVDRPPVETVGAITFGSLNNFCKVNTGVLSAWAEVMNRVPGSRLLLHAHPGDHRDATARFLAERGISPDRLAFVGMVRAAQYLAHYNYVDVALDPFPYNGGTTTFDALWMGVPVVSLAADRAVGRAGRSILTHVGLPELVADDVAGYVRTAVEVAGDRARLAELRRTVRDRLMASPAADLPAFARDIEAAYRQMWRAWCVSVV